MEKLLHDALRRKTLVQINLDSESFKWKFRACIASILISSENVMSRLINRICENEQTVLISFLFSVSSPFYLSSCL